MDRLSFLRRRFWRAEDGATAVEFGMVVLPFCMMMFAILELGIIFVTDSVMENAAIDTGRLVRTGQASAQNMTAAQFKTAFCSRMSVFSADCASRASIDVRVIPQFNFDPPNPAEGDSFDESRLTYANGNPGDLILVRVWYRQPLLTPLFSQGVSTTGNGETMLVATTAFRNEPA